MNNLLCRKWF